MKKIYIIITGTVTGVGFRWWLKTEAQKRKIYGFVRNRNKNEVEAVLLGNKEDLDMLSEGEIRELTASVYIFLTKFGSTALAKQFVTATKEIQPKEQTQ